jgi:hypothetical protein
VPPTLLAISGIMEKSQTENLRKGWKTSQDPPAQDAGRVPIYKCSVLRGLCEPRDPSLNFWTSCFWKIKIRHVCDTWWYLSISYGCCIFSLWIFYDFYHLIGFPYLLRDLGNLLN